MIEKIKIESLNKKFDGKVILKEINLSIFESESLAIIGESGSGKSVLTKCLSGLIDFDSGQINYQKSYDVKKINHNERLNHISKFGVLFQNAALFDSLTIRENIMFKKKSLNINSVLNDVGLDSSCLDLFPSDLSVGMQKRVGLARAIFSEPEILILDEPTTGLDPIMCYQINKLIRKLVEKRKITTITITHDMESVYEFADKVAFINDGIISWYGDTNKIKLSKNKILNNFIQGNS